MRPARIANRKMRLCRAIRRAVAIASRLWTFCRVRARSGAKAAAICDKIASTHCRRRLPLPRMRARSNALGFAVSLFTPFVAFALVGIEQLLAQPDRFRRDLDQLI